MAIKVWDYLEEYEIERDDILEGIEKVLKSGRLILGESVKNFESSFASYCGVKHGIGVDNGTNAIFLALKAIGIGAGEEVITVSNTAVPTVSAIVAAGATPRFIDINPETYLMDVTKIASAITERTRCILPVHLFGQCVDMDPLLEIANRYNLYVIEDCAQSHGATYKGSRKAGSMATLGTFSFYPTKILGGYGDGGMVITNNDELDVKLRRLRFYGMEKVYYSEEIGYNSRLDELHAEILLRKLKHMEQYIAKRQALAERYDEILKNTSLTLPVTLNGNGHVYYLYVCRHSKRDYIIEELAKREIFVNISYPWPIHTMRGYCFLGYEEGNLPETELAAKQIFSLPMYPMLSYEAQDKVCLALGEILGEQVNL
ncbi:MAG: DegT/DnrJ/EryC1/StrS family aminotransferase [Nitrospirota bacterium]